MIGEDVVVLKVQRLLFPIDKNYNLSLINYCNYCLVYEQKDNKIIPTMEGKGEHQVLLSNCQIPTLLLHGNTTTVTVQSLGRCRLLVQE